jgi:hypothetical protein
VGKERERRWFWHAVDHRGGEVLADVFGRRQDGVFLRLKALLEPLFSLLQGNGMGELYNRAAALDKAIADRWKTRTNENFQRNLMPADVDFIVGPVFKGRITERQGQALVAIFEVSRFTLAALARLQQIVTKAMNADNLNLVPMVTEADLLPYMKALSRDVVSQIMYNSPGTGITYTPYDYLVIRDLISTDRIPVFEARVGGLSKVQLGAAAVYNTTKERIVVYEHNASDKLARAMTIVHEATHVIQDWRDLPSLIHHEETDAAIAESVVEQVLKGTVLGIDDDPVTVAAQYVIRKQTDKSNGAWLKAYKRAVEETAKSVKKPGLRGTVETRGRRQNELYEQLLSAVKARYTAPH